MTEWSLSEQHVWEALALKGCSCRASYAPEPAINNTATFKCCTCGARVGFYHTGVMLQVILEPTPQPQPCEDCGKYTCRCWTPYAITYEAKT